MIKSILLGVFLSVTFQTKMLEGVVTNVQDGDTIDVLIDGKTVAVRLNGIDCPEDGQGYSAKAKQYTTLHCLKKKIKLEKVTTDPRGRMIANVFLEDGTDVCQALVAGGYAWHYKKFSTDAKLAALEKEARKKKIGIWIEENPMAPWEFKEKKKN